ncbi:ATP-binding protein [Phenylobacterium sp.]|uniref:ATP-binding protein n=1 Tax=Phenylobacterium sp. TaxID=1871053 RepID=UPI0025CFE0B8|nr:ATP-binding protein [Phenylobacterium sp.]
MGATEGRQTAANGAPGDNAELALGLLRIAQRNNWPTMLVQIAASLGVYVAARAHAPNGYDAWIAIVLAISAGRILVDHVLGRLMAAEPATPPARLRRWGRAHSAGLLASATMWAILAWWRLPVEDARIQFTIIIVLSALVGGASGVLAPLKTTGRIYIVTLLFPACLRMLLSIPEQTVLGVLGLAFMAVILGMHRNNHLILLRSIELGRENLVLVDALQAQNEEVIRINHSLEARVAERTEALRASAIKAESASRLKSEFLATISHEIRTPLNAVLGMTQVMAFSPLDPAQKTRLSVIESSAKMLLAIFNDVLDISKIEAGTMEIAPAEFQLERVIRQAAERFAALAGEKGLRFELVVGDRALGHRYGDALRLRQILGNLASNAVKFTERGEVRLDVEADAEQLVVRVTDTGVGISDEARTLVFDRFIQADGSNTRRAGGLGMGLALSRDLAALMGGSLSLESTVGAGSCFTLTVPMPALQVEAATATQVEPAEPEGLRILMVDDNATNRMVLRAMLEQSGLDACEATDGQEAVSAWRTGDWDVILMDINMPVMDGLDAARAIRAGEAQQRRRRTPIIAVTASAQPEDAATYRAAGMDEVVAKPVDVASLMSALSRQLDRAQAA